MGARVVALSLVVLYWATVGAQVLTPPYFNLAEGSRISASATCGADVPEPELFCRLTGANADEQQRIHSVKIIQGQLCDYCNPLVAEQAHPPEFAIDGTERWWQSPPFSRGMQYSEVNLTVDLGQEFHVAYVFIKMANSPRPDVWALDRSLDGGQTWEAWQYFAETSSDCYNFFKLRASNKPDTDTDVICTTEFSKVVPLENGEIAVSLVQNRPGSNNFTFSAALQNFTRATNVRLRLLRAKTLYGHLMAVARKDPTVTRRYFYSIKDVSIGGRCVCNGHADVCDKTDPLNPYKLVCRCQHNTCGDQCERCCDGFVQKPWRRATELGINACEPCQCYGHATKCRYDDDVARLGQSIDIHGSYSGGGICTDCEHNTEGINCERCKFGYYRPAGKSRDAIDVCQKCQCDLSVSTGGCEDETARCICKPQFDGPNCDRCAYGYYGYPDCRPCDCFLNGTDAAICTVGGGQCPCKINFSGKNCNRCAPGYYNFPECRPCACDVLGSINNVCDELTGKCSCKYNHGGALCDQCEDGYYGYPDCKMCDCDITGSETDICHKSTGACKCKQNFLAPRCDRCAPSFYGYPACQRCGCSEPGSVGNSCDDSGQCRCYPPYSGLKCDQCAAGHYRYPECGQCECSAVGAIGRSCDQLSAQCSCRPNFAGLRCDRCAPDFYNFPACESCSCNPAGAAEKPGYPLGGCGAFSDGRLCECKSRVAGRICDTCKPGFWNLRASNPEGCEDCSCNRDGTIVGDNMCDPVSGQCSCKINVNTRRCDTCVDGTYKLQGSDLFGCTDCECDPGGALHEKCDKVTGSCQCRNFIEGRRCSQPLNLYYFPILHHLKYELEEGYTPYYTDVRFGFDRSPFPDFSWRGYATFSHLQPEVLVSINIDKPSLFRIMYRYVNRNSETVTATIVLTPETETSTDSKQSDSLSFPNTLDGPRFAMTGTSFLLSSGKWTVSLKTDNELYVDYMVLLPQPYYEASVLQDRVKMPCLAPDNGKPCLHYVYVDVSPYPRSTYDSAYALDSTGTKQSPQLYANDDVLLAVGSPQLVVAARSKPRTQFDLAIPAQGQYVILVTYINPARSLTATVSLSGNGSDPASAEDGKAVLYRCQYSSLCRQVVVDASGRIKAFSLQPGPISVALLPDTNEEVAVESVTAIPRNHWDTRILKPAVSCIRFKDECQTVRYPDWPTAVKAEAEASPNENLRATDLPETLGANSAATGLVKLHPGHREVFIYLTLPNTEPHVFVVQYHQPRHTGIVVNLTVTANGIPYPGYIDAVYCPNVAGCRALVEFYTYDSESHVLSVLPSPNITVQVMPPAPSKSQGHNATVWIDYLLAVPSFDFNPSVLLNLEPLDLSAAFITQCSNDGTFHVDPSTASVFCRQSVFSITAEHNNGALQCGCDSRGSLDLKCNEFGGQCRCRPNVIGRQCTACATGYYGFPDCKLCRCPALCEPTTGACICPPRVTGRNCDTCVAETFGLDPMIGCEDCRCNEEGVLNGNTTCDVRLGQCDCKPNVGGRQCDRCKDGYYNFPACSDCGCDPAGTVDETCDKTSGRCLCKENTIGDACGRCRPGTFYLESRNPKGCTQCFCFGKTTSCLSSSYLLSIVEDMTGPWTFSDVDATVTVVTPSGVSALSDSTSPVAAHYWGAPPAYLGNKVTSYGSQLTYSYSVDRQAGVVLRGPDVRLRGRGMTLVYERVGISAASYQVKLDLLESNLRHETTGSPVTRDQLMLVLSKLQAIEIKAGSWSEATKFTLSAVKLGMAVDQAGQPLTGLSASASAEPHASMLGPTAVLNVEICQCPPQYKGTSCEDCAEGFYLRSEPHQREVCVPCECNGHSSRCDPETGRCLGCQNNTMGDHCEQCVPGYYGDPPTGGCTICSCPMPTASNNFAKSCSATSDGRMLSCDCPPGYLPPFCEKCAPGFFGDPFGKPGSCIPCGCNDNIDRSDPSGCHPTFGHCLRCLANTFGDSCEQCQDFFWGDAVDSKNCTECDCDRTGSSGCDKATGQCFCKPNVVGDRCDRCAPNTFGFASGNGCTACSCQAGSSSAQCDLVTGQCVCQKGVVGRRCDQCAPRHWNYSTSGCKECSCHYPGATRCDVMTGICQCQPGVTGEHCDRCEPRWVLIPDRGCESCDSCVHTLLDDTDRLASSLNETMTGLNRITVSKEAERKLRELNASAAGLEESLASLPKSPANDSALLRAQEMFPDFDALISASEATADRILSDPLFADSSYFKALETVGAVNVTVNSATARIGETLAYMSQRRSDVLKSQQLVNADRMLREARELVAKMEASFPLIEKHKADADVESANATALLERVRAYENQVEDQSHVFRQMTKALLDVANRISDLLQQADSSLVVSFDVAGLLGDLQQQLRLVQEKLASVNEDKAHLEGMITKSAVLTRNATSLLNSSQNAFKALETNITALREAVARLQQYYDHLQEGNAKIIPLTKNASEHAEHLKQQAEMLAGLLTDTRLVAEAALKAATAYDTIVTSISNAMNASKNALRAAIDAIDQSADISNITAMAKAESESLQEKANSARDPMLNSSLQAAKQSVEKLAGTKSIVDNSIKATKDQLAQLPSGQGARAAAATDLAANARSVSQKAADASAPIIAGVNQDLVRVKETTATISRINSALNAARTSLNQATEFKGTVFNISARLIEHRTGLKMLQEDLSKNITALREMIRQARDTANKIALGVTMYPNSSLQLRAPERLRDAFSASSLVSLHFKTSAPNGLLFYLGPKSEKDRETVDEFIALEMVDGAVVYRYNLGDKTAEIRSTRTYNDSEWHKAIFERTGALGILRVTSVNSATEQVKGSASGVFSSFDVDPRFAKIFLGGVPDDFTLPPVVANRKFNGAIEDIKYSSDNLVLGPWNFVQGEQNFQGASRGDALAEVVCSAVRFRRDAKSYLTLEKRTWAPAITATIKITFLTVDKNGLLFFVGQDPADPGKVKDFMKIAIVNGKVVFTMQLGSGPLEVNNSRHVADGVMHTLLVQRSGSNVTISVDDGVKTTGSRSGSRELNLGAAPELQLGGLAGTSAYFQLAPEPYFDGCIQDLLLNNVRRNLRSQVDVAFGIGTTSGCSIVKHGVTFRAAPANSPEGTKDGGYLRILSDESHFERFELSMRFKSNRSEGLLFFTSDDDLNNALSVSLVDGKIKVIDTPGDPKKNNTVMTDVAFNDYFWHYLSISKDGLTLTLTVDDKFISKSTATHRTRRTKSNGNLYIGGTSVAISPTSLVGSDARFFGCISDIVINKTIINLVDANVTAVENAALESCDIPDPEPVSTTPAVPTTPVPEAGSPALDMSESALVDMPAAISDASSSSATTSQPPQDVIDSDQKDTAAAVNEASSPAQTEPSSESSATEPATTSTAAPTQAPPAQCGSLPLAAAAGDRTERGLRFGLSKDSRVEHKTFASIKNPSKALMLKNRVRFEVQTTSSNGLVWTVLAKAGGAGDDYAAVYVQDGYLVYQVDLGSGAGMIKSSTTVHDGKWHSVEIARSEQQLKLIVDGAELGHDVRGSSKSLNVDMPVYVGGLNASDERLTKLRRFIAAASTANFVGCVANMQYFGGVDWEDYGSPEVKIGVRPCVPNQEGGAFFSSDDGSLVLREQFNVEQSVDISLEIKPRSSSGLIFAAWSSREPDYLVLQMIDGALQLSVSNGPQSELTVRHDASQSLCDGSWHSVTAKKIKNALELTVDSMTVANTSSVLLFSADTNSPLYLGGLPEGVLGKGVDASVSNFVGCIRQVKIDSEDVNLSAARVIGAVEMSCPTN